MYKLIGTNLVKRLADGAYIPFADGNVDYEEYKQWLSEGNTPEPEFNKQELIEQFQTKFRFDRDTLLKNVDIEINKSEDNGLDSTNLRAYRQSLRDATINWIMPERNF